MKFSTMEEAEKYAEEMEAKLSNLQKTADIRKQERIDTEKKLADINKQLESFKGFDMEEFKKLQDEKAEREKADLEAKGEYDKLVAQKDEVIAQLQTKIKESDSKAEKAIADSLGREKEFHLSQLFLENGGNPKHVSQFLKVRGDAFDYAVGDDGKGALRPVETQLDKENKEMDAKGYVTSMAESEEFGIYFKPKSDSSTGIPAGGNNGTGERTPFEGRTWV